MRNKVRGLTRQGHTRAVFTAHPILASNLTSEGRGQATRPVTVERRSHWVAVYKGLRGLLERRVAPGTPRAAAFRSPGRAPTGFRRFRRCTQGRQECYETPQNPRGSEFPRRQWSLPG